MPEDSEGKYIPGCIAVCDSHCNGKPEDILAPLADLFIDHQMLAHAYYLLKELQKQMSDVADIQELVTELERYL